MNEQYAALRAGAGLSSEGGAVVVVRGPDAIDYLQSLVSADLGPVTDGGGVHSLLLTPQGKLDVDFRLLRVGSECWLYADTGLGPRLAGSLLRFKIRVDIEVEDRSDDWSVLMLRGSQVAAVVAGAAGPEVPASQHDHDAWGAARLVRADWPGVAGVDVIGPRAELARHRAALLSAGAVEVGEDAFEACRIEAGVPRQSRDLDDKLIPQEAFLDRDAISFTKGCFLGQELVARIDSRGHVNRALRGVRLGAAAPPGAEVVAAGKPVGALTSVAVSPVSGPVALALVRRELEPPAAVTVAGNPATVEALPLLPG